MLLERHFPRYRPARLAFAALFICVLLLSCGLTTLAAGEGPPDTPVTEEKLPGPDVPGSLPALKPEKTQEELYPSDIQTVTGDGSRQIVKTYTLAPEQDPAAIPREAFTRDGWRYTLTDITEKRNAGTDTRHHSETVEINTDTGDLNGIIKVLAPSLDYESADGYCGTLTLDLSSVKCETAGYRNSSYTVSAVREYPHLSANDLSLIPKTVTENGRTLTLDDVSWETQNRATVDYEQIPDSYRAVAKYTTAASKSVAAGYITTAEYTGEIAGIITGDTVYTAYFAGTEINPTPEPAKTPGPAGQGGNGIPFVPVLAGLAVSAVLTGVGAFFFLRRNVKIYRDGFRVLTAKDKISRKKLTVDLSPLEGTCFGIEIDKYTAKALNGGTLKVIYGPGCLKHKIAFEGGVYKLEADFNAETIRAIY